MYLANCGDPSSADGPLWMTWLDCVLCLRNSNFRVGVNRLALRSPAFAPLFWAVSDFWLLISDFYPSLVTCHFSFAAPAYCTLMARVGVWESLPLAAYTVQ